MWDYLQIIPSQNAILAVTLITAKIKFMQYQSTTDDFIFANGIAPIALQNGDIKK